MSVISKNQVSLAGEFAVLSQLAAAVFALALLTPAFGAEIYAHENYVVIWGRIEMGDDADFKKTVTLATRTIYLVSPGGYLPPRCGSPWWSGTGSTRPWSALRSAERAATTCVPLAAR